MNRKAVVCLWVFVLLSAVVPGSSPARVAAESKTVFRFATLIPQGTPYMDLFRKWNRQIEEVTNNQVEFRFYNGGSQGDERDFIRKMRVGQLDGAALSNIGLGILVRPVLVLAAPGLMTDYDQLASVRAHMDERFAALFEQAGFKLVAWGDAGKARVFSTQHIIKPTDMKAARPWVWRDDPIFTEFLRVVGANLVRLGLPEVYPGLQTRMIDTVPASAVATIALQWFTRLKYVSKQNFGILVGAMVVKKEKLDALPPEHQQVIMEIVEEGSQTLDRLVRRDDRRAYQSLVQRGLLQEVDTSPHQAEWHTAFRETRTRLAGRVYSKQLLQEVQNAAASGQF